MAFTAGSWFGSAVSYWISRWVGLPVVERFGKYVLIGPDKVAMAQRWVLRYGAPGSAMAGPTLPIHAPHACICSADCSGV